MATQGTIEDPAQAPARTGQGRVETLGVPGLAFTHARDRRTGEEDPAAPTGHPQDHRAGLFEREARGVRQQDQGHRTTSLPWSCSDAMDSTSDYHNPRSNPRKQQKPRKIPKKRTSRHRRRLWRQPSRVSRRAISASIASAPSMTVKVSDLRSVPCGASVCRSPRCSCQPRPWTLEFEGSRPTT